jgi:hypothetical protein
MAALVIMLHLIVLHAPVGGAIYVNPDTVTTMRAATAEKNKHITDQAKCLLNTSDGKFIAVIETCDEVRRLFRQTEGREP